MSDPAPEKLPGDWMENVQNLANGVHFTLSGYVLLITALFSHKSPHMWWWIGGVEIFLAVFVLVKEYWYDLKYETGETIKSSTVDALGWLFGNFFCWCLLGLAHYLTIWP